MYHSAAGTDVPTPSAEQVPRSESGLRHTNGTLGATLNRRWDNIELTLSRILSPVRVFSLPKCGVVFPSAPDLSKNLSKTNGMHLELRRLFRRSNFLAPRSVRNENSKWSDPICG